MSALELGKVLGVFVNTLSADDKYSVQYCQNLQLPIQMQLSEKRRRFSEFFVPFLDCTWEFKDIEKKMMVIANVFPKLQTVKNLVRPLSKRRRFRTRFDSQHLKVSQTHRESPCQRFDHFFHHCEGS